MPTFRSMSRLALALLAASGWMIAAHGQSGRPAKPTPPLQRGEKVDPAEQWPDFRGPGGLGISRGKGIPLEWSETKNVRWKIPVHGQAWSSPVAWGGQVWLTTATPDGREMSALCVDRATGKVLLDRVLFTNPTVEERGPGHESNSYASPSPVIEAGRVYFHFGKYGTACLDTATFKTLWQRRDLLCTHSAGPGSSPVLFRNLLLLTYDGIDHQFLAALDTKTGKTVWKRPRSVDWAVLDPPGKTPDLQQRKAFSTPLVTTWAGKPVLVSSGAKATCGYDPSTGEELWKVTYKGFSNASRPVAGGGLAYVNSGYPRADLLAVRLGGTGDVTTTHVAWQTSKNVPLNPSPLLLDGLLYLVTGGGIATCLDAVTGAEVWKDRLDGPISASPVLIEGRIFVFTESGKAFVLEPGRQFKKVAESQLEDGLMGSPAVIGRSLILRTKSHLYCIEAMNQQAMRP
jgi:outer membrane protein assembly factor BamB